MDASERAAIAEITGTLEPQPGPNRALPPLNPLWARSTYALLIAFLSVVSPFLGGGVGEIVADVLANEEEVGAQVETIVIAVNALLGIVGVSWFWMERRAPNYRLSFKSR